jgi:hypothetical protein
MGQLVPLYATEWTWFYHDRLAKRDEATCGAVKPWWDCTS